MGEKLKGGVLVFAAALMWSAVGLILKTATAGIGWIIFIRSVSAGVFLLPFVFRRPIFPMKSVVWTGVFYTLLMFAFGYTTKLGNSAMAVSMQYAAPAYLLGFMFLKNKAVAKKSAVTFLLLSLGIALNVISAMKTAASISIVTGLLTGVSFLLYTYYMQKIEKGSPLGIVSLVNLICAGFSLVFLLLVPADMPDSKEAVLGFVATGIVVSAISYVLYRMGLEKITLSSAMLISLAELLLNPVWVLLATGEAPPVMTMIGLLLIFAGAVWDIVKKPF